MMDFRDIVKQAANVSGLQPFTLGAAADGYQTMHDDRAVGTLIGYKFTKDGEIEMGVGTLTGPNTLTRTFPATTSNDGALVNFSAGVGEIEEVLTASTLNAFLTEVKLASLGQPVPSYLAANASGALSAADLFMMVQGNSVVGANAGTLAEFVNARWPAATTAAVIIATTAPFPLDFATHHRRELFCTAAATINAPGVFSSVGNNYECAIAAEGGDVTLGGGFVMRPAGSASIVPNGTVAQIRARNGVLYARLSPSAAMPDIIAPTAPSAAVSNGTPTVVNIVMSEVMDPAYVPAATAFTVSGHVVSSVAISGSTINLTCSAAFVNGEAARTASYTQPGTNNARDLAGNLLANFAGLTITNNVGVAGDTTAPTLTSPTGTQTGATTASGTVTTDEGNGTLYFLASTSATATAAAVKAGGAQAITTTGSKSLSVTGLTQSTLYYLHYLHRDAAGNDSAVVTSVSFTTAASGGGGGVAPFTLTAKTDFPTAIAWGAADYLWHNIVATGTATITSITAAISTSNTIVPTSSLAEGTTPKGRWLGTVFHHYGAGTDYIYETGPVIGYSVASPTDYYMWIQIVDSNGATWNFCRTKPISVGPSGTAKTTDGAAIVTPQVP